MRLSLLSSLALAFGTLGTPAIGWADPPIKEERKAPSDDRDELAAKLMERVTLKDGFKETSLQDILAYFNDKFALPVLLDTHSFNPNPGAVALNGDALEPEKVILTIPPMKNVRLGTILKFVTDKLDAIYLIYPDHVRIVSVAKATAILKLTPKPQASDPDPNGRDEENLAHDAVLVTLSIRDKPLREALKDLESRSNQTIVLANQTADTAETSVTACFANVPIERAVATLAEMAGLTSVLRGNVLLVTTEDRAKELYMPPSQQPAVSPHHGFCGVGGFPANPVDELRQKLALLEQKLAEANKDKK